MYLIHFVSDNLIFSVGKHLFLINGQGCPGASQFCTMIQQLMMKFCIALVNNSFNIFLSHFRHFNNNCIITACPLAQSEPKLINQWGQMAVTWGQCQYEWRMIHNLLDAPVPSPHRMSSCLQPSQPHRRNPCTPFAPLWLPFTPTSLTWGCGLFY